MNCSFTNIKTLEIESYISVLILRSKIDLDQVKHLSLLSIDYILTYELLSDTMPQLRELSIQNSVDLYTIKLMRHHRFEQIHKLKIIIHGK